MKQILPILFFLISFSVSAQSSVWTKGNAVWHYGFVNIGTSGYIKLWEDGTIVLEGKTCIKMKSEKHSFSSAVPEWNIPASEVVSDYFESALYVSNDTVFYWNMEQERFFVLFDFSAQQNENWILDIAPTENYGCNDTSVCVVQSVGSLMLGGQNVVELNLGKTADSYQYFSGKANSRFGTTESYLFPFITVCEEGVFLDLDQIEFLCFEDDSLYYNPSGGACEYYLGLDESAMNSVSIFPNPSQGKIGILSEIPLKNIRLMNVAGATLKEIESNLTLEEIDLSEFPQGTYYLNIENSNGEHTVKQIQLSGR